MTDPQFYALLRKRLDDDIREHSPTLDAWCFNGGTLLTLAMMSAAALFSSKTFGPDSTWVGAVLLATAGVLVAAERALAFGARWRFHHEMRNGYRSLLDMVDFATLLPEGPEKQKYVKDIWTALYALRSRESSIPRFRVGTAINAWPLCRVEPSSQVEHPTRSSLAPLRNPTGVPKTSSSLLT